jgi:hypothetical protein
LSPCSAAFRIEPTNGHAAKGPPSEYAGQPIKKKLLPQSKSLAFPEDGIPQRSIVAPGFIDFRFFLRSFRAFHGIQLHAISLGTS